MVSLGQFKKKKYRRNGYCPDYISGPGGDMPPWMGDPCSDDMWGPGGNTPLWRGDTCSDDTRQPREDATENMSSGPNAPNQRQHGTSSWPEKSSWNKQPKDPSGTNSWENGPLPSGSCSSHQPASQNIADTLRDSTEESAARILANFGLSAKDLEEFRHYSDDELKPENMAVILRDIMERKKSRQLPTSSQGKGEENFGRHSGYDSLMKTGPVVPSAAQPAATPAASLLPQSSVSPPSSMMNDHHAALPTVFPQAWNLHVGSPAHTEKRDQLRQDHEGDKKENHVPMPCSASSSLKRLQCSCPDHAGSQTRSRSRSPDPNSRKRSRSWSPGCRSRSSERASSSISSFQSSSSQKRKLGSSTKSPAFSAETGRSSRPPAESDVAEQPPNTPHPPLQTNPGPQEPPKGEAATQGQGERPCQELVATQGAQAALDSKDPKAESNPEVAPDQNPRKKRRCHRAKTVASSQLKVTWGMLKALTYDAQCQLQSQGIKEEPETLLAAIMAQLNANSVSLQ